MFFESWSGLARIIIIGVCAYLALLVLLRVSGKRTLSKMNAFDFVITVALGSTLATIILSRDTPLAEGVLALGLLIFLQFAITWLAVRSQAINRLVKTEPRLLLHRGAFLHSVMKAERIPEEEVFQALRTQGIASPAEVEAVVLETDGTLSVVKKPSAGESGALADVH